MHEKHNSLMEKHGETDYMKNTIRSSGDADYMKNTMRSSGGADYDIRVG